MTWQKLQYSLTRSAASDRLNKKVPGWISQNDAGARRDAEMERVLAASPVAALCMSTVSVDTWHDRLCGKSAVALETKLPGDVVAVDSTTVAHCARHCNAAVAKRDAARETKYASHRASIAAEEAERRKPVELLERAAALLENAASGHLGVAKLVEEIRAYLKP